MIPQTRYFLPSLLAAACTLLSPAYGRADSVVNGVFTPTPTSHKFPYWGIDDGWQERLEEIQGVRFLNAAGAAQEAFQTMGNAGLNAVRVTVELGEPLVTTPLTGTGAQKGFRRRPTTAARPSCGSSCLLTESGYRGGTPGSERPCVSNAPHPPANVPGGGFCRRRPVERGGAQRDRPGSP